MCLIVCKGALPRKAHTDITVYKVVQKTDGGSFISPYMGTHLFTEGNLPITKVDQKDFRVVRNTLKYGHDKVYEGGFHCYKHLADAIYEKNFLNRRYSIRYYVVECIIPKGTIYYDGEYFVSQSFCTQKLIINKIIS